MTLSLRRLALLLLIAVAVAVPASAQRFELSPAGSYVFSSNFEVEDFDFGRIDVDLDDTDGLTLFADFKITRSLQFELLYSAHETELEVDEGLLSESFPIADTDVEYLHAGVLFQAALGQVRPYFALTGGLTRIDVALAGTDSETYPSIGLGGGVKVLFTDHFGLRADARFFFTSLDDDDFYDRRYDDDFDCCRRCCDDDDESLTQGIVSVGLLFAF